MGKNKAHIKEFMERYQSVQCPNCGHRVMAEIGYRNLWEEKEFFSIVSDCCGIFNREKDAFRCLTCGKTFAEVGIMREIETSKVSQPPVPR